MRGPVQKGIDPELQRQAEYIVNTVKNEQKTGEGLWHHGGTGSGYKNAEGARKVFINARTPASSKARAFSLGYVRPKGGIEEATYNHFNNNEFAQKKSVQHEKFVI